MNWQIYAILSLVLLGAFYTSMKFALAAGINPQLAAVVLQFAALVSVGIYFIANRASIPLQYTQTSLTYAVLAGVFVGAANLVLYLALSSGPVSKISPITGMAVMIPAVVGILYFKEPASLKVMAGLLCAVAGILLLST
ncbi:MAG: EamA family transporter [archaeon]